MLSLLKRSRLFCLGLVGAGSAVAVQVCSSADVLVNGSWQCPSLPKAISQFLRAGGLSGLRDSLEMSSASRDLCQPGLSCVLSAHRMSPVLWLGVLSTLLLPDPPWAACPSTARSWKGVAAVGHQLLSFASLSFISKPQDRAPSWPCSEEGLVLPCSLPLPC